MKDFLDPENAKGMPDLMDMAITTDFLVTVKSAITNYAVAITEAVNPSLRKLLRNQLEDYIMLHGEITELMLHNKWLHPSNLPEQYKLDMKAAQTAADIAGLELFPHDTDRLGMFATPTNKESKENQL